MTHTLFLQSEVQDPYAIYAEMLATQPVFRDERNGILALYAYDACKRVLDSTRADIPRPGNTMAHPMSARAATLADNLVRLANPPLHASLRQAAMHLYQALTPVDAGALLHGLLEEADASTARELDWVGAVGKKLPALAVLSGFGFSRRDIARILPQVAPLTKIMLPAKTEQQVQELNAAVAEVCPLVEQHMLRMPALATLIDGGEPQERQTRLDIYAGNLIGLLIQSCDAGRGLLGNALLQTLAHPPAHATADTLHKAVIESLRFDPPIHNTRRVLAADMTLNGMTLAKGETVLLVLAAANRDPAKFDHPERYDAERPNNGDHLSFGAGMHMCVAQHLSVQLAVDALTALFGKYRRVALLQQRIMYEPLVNARLPREIRIALG
ncbi:cytochrome P450 [Noviherbaspirillum cavernae]|uniref:Cytochrome P450 n=1 Tax=Noviherbaspirillum cavernae TaxID=2320862 RepID=A0A418X4N7_9BURK|nr:cytochrome P450 [Noviherbaspirillum cavernae]RJG07447.1 cytochrome P450 [Noviherbaspirillum cavernae]